MSPASGAERLLQRIDAAWSELRDSYAGLSAAQLEESGVVGEWAIKDVLAHVTVWEEEALEHLPTVARGGRPPRYAAQGGIDAFNARMLAEKRQLSLAAVLEKMDDTHRRLIDYLVRTPERQLANRARFLRRLRLDTYAHYRLHADAIRAGRALKPL